MKPNRFLCGQINQNVRTVNSLQDGHHWDRHQLSVLGRKTAAKTARRDGHQGLVVRKPINANPGLKVNPGFNFSSMKVFLTANIL